MVFSINFFNIQRSIINDYLHPIEGDQLRKTVRMPVRKLLSLIYNLPSFKWILFRAVESFRGEIRFGTSFMPVNQLKHVSVSNKNYQTTSEYLPSADYVIFYTSTSIFCRFCSLGFRLLIITVVQMEITRD